MKRLLLLTAAGLTVVALAGAVGLPDLAGAQDATATPDTITVTGVGTVDAVPNEAQMSFGVETRKPTAQAAVAANADAMRKIINALRQAGARELATQWVSVYPYTDETGNVNGYSASNSVSAVSDVGDAPGTDRCCSGGRREPDLRARAELEQRRGSLPAGAREGRRRGSPRRRGAREGCRPLARLDHHDRRGRRIQPDSALPRGRCSADSSTPIVPGEQETTREHQRHLLPPLIVRRPDSRWRRFWPATIPGRRPLRGRMTAASTPRSGWNRRCPRPERLLCAPSCDAPRAYLRHPLPWPTDRAGRWLARFSLRTSSKEHQMIDVQEAVMEAVPVRWTRPSRSHELRKEFRRKDDRKRGRSAASVACASPSTASRSRWRRARPSPSSARTARGSRRSSACSRRSCSPTAGRPGSSATTSSPTSGRFVASSTASRSRRRSSRRCRRRRTSATPRGSTA